MDRQIAGATERTVIEYSDVVACQKGDGTTEGQKLKVSTLHKKLTGKKIYGFTFIQTGTAAPTVVDVINQLEVAITWTRVSLGHYRATSGTPSIFLSTKVFVQKIVLTKNFDTTDIVLVAMIRNNDDSFDLYTYRAGALQDGVLTDTGVNAQYLEYPVFY